LQAVAHPLGQVLGYGRALLRELDGLVEDASQGHGAEALQRQLPSSHTAGGLHGQGAVGRDIWHAALAEEVDGRGLWRGAAGVDGHHAAFLGKVDQAEEVASQAGHVGADHGQHGRGGDGGVDHVAAIHEHS